MRKKVLLVEDDKTISSLLSDALDKYEVQTAIDGIYGLKICKLQQPDLVIVDLSLPRMPGEELVENIRKDEKLKSIPIIVISGTFSRKYTGEKLDTIAADAVFSKPLDLEQFTRVVDTLIK